MVVSLFCGDGTSHYGAVFVCRYCDLPPKCCSKSRTTCVQDRGSIGLVFCPIPCFVLFCFGLVTCATTNEVRLYVWPLIRIDCLYVEQEVVADDTPAVIAVMKADKARQGLT